MKECMFCRTQHDDRLKHCPVCNRVLLQMPEVPFDAIEGNLSGVSSANAKASSARQTYESRHTHTSASAGDFSFTGLTVDPASETIGDLRRHFSSRRRGLIASIADNWGTIRSVFRVLLIAAAIIGIILYWKTLLAVGLSMFIGALIVTVLVSLPFRHRGIPAPLLNASITIGAILGFAFYFNLGSIREITYSSAVSIVYYIIIFLVIRYGISMIFNAGRARR